MPRGITISLVVILEALMLINPFVPTVAFLQHLLAERLTSLGIRGAQLRAPLKPPVHHSTIVLSELRGFLCWAPKELYV